MKPILLFLAAAAICSAADLAVLPAHVRVDPFGQVVAADRAAAVAPARKITLTTPRAAYASCRLLVTSPRPVSYRLSVAGPLAQELHREWFHFLPALKLYYPDALVPAASPVQAQLPDPDNRIAGQTAQSYWLDIWIPATAAPGVSRLTATVDAAGHGAGVEIELHILEAVVPDTDAVAIDHNSYGTSWFSAQYPTLAARPGFYLSDAFFGLIHAYHRVFYEHRGVYHQLGYGHGGKVGPEFAPRLEGTGRTRRVADWTLYDKHYGPLLDGSAFAATRHGARPIPFVYTPVNPEWPAQFLWWGEPGYEQEFVNVMREWEAHFRQKGWTRTKLELFFNHKKRYKAFHWDGDETRFAKDLPFFAEYLRLWKLAFPQSSPVPWAFRADASWQMERQFREQAGLINFWICASGMFGWYAEQAAALKARGDIVWLYSGTPPVARPSSHIARDVLAPWLAGVDGFVRWQTVLPGDDPWFAFEGGGQTLVYPGDRFGIHAPLPSVRLKLERNVLQDLALLDRLQARVPLDTLRREAARRFNGTEPADWRAKRPALADTNPEEWNNADINEAIVTDPRFEASLDAGAWHRVHVWLLELLKESRS